MCLDPVYFVENIKKSFFSYCSLLKLLFIGLFALFMGVPWTVQEGLSWQKKKKKKLKRKMHKTWTWDMQNKRTFSFHLGFDVSCNAFNNLLFCLDLSSDSTIPLDSQMINCCPPCHLPKGSSISFPSSKSRCCSLIYHPIWEEYHSPIKAP